MANIIHTLSVWVGDGTPGNPYRPRLTVDYPQATWTDTSGADPGVGLVNGVEATVSDALYTTISGDASAVILWRRVRDDTTGQETSTTETATLTTTQANALKTWLVNRGVAQADADRIAVAGRTRRDVAADLIALWRAR